ncbi:MAG: hypothetical protein M3O06_11135, partial [Pseudomonadota bacterium]|nr:hypothetical protein [Pseudomonadota bacterium]
EQYLGLHAPPRISFEHAWFLLLALSRRDEIGIVRCSVCGGVRLRDLLGRRGGVCAHCAVTQTTEAPGATPEVTADAAPC